MTFAELERYFKSRKRVIEIQEKKQASFDYVLADLIGRSIARIYNSSNKMPSISEAYPSLFNSDEMQEQAQARKDELSAMRFKQFAQSYNSRFKEVSKKDE